MILTECTPFTVRSVDTDIWKIQGLESHNGSLYGQHADWVSKLPDPSMEVKFFQPDETIYMLP